MRKISFVLCALWVSITVGCSSKPDVIQLAPNHKLVTVTAFGGTVLSYVTRPMRPGEKPETYKVIGGSSSSDEDMIATLIEQKSPVEKE